MERIQMLLADPAFQLGLWMVLAPLGLVLSGLTIYAMFRETQLHPAALNVPMIRSMKQHDINSELVRMFGYVVALIVGVSALFNVVPGWVVGLLLITLLGILDFNSANELRLTWSLLYGPPDAHRVHREDSDGTELVQPGVEEHANMEETK